MAQQVRSAVAWVYRNAARFGGDPARLYITGHSSGAHLAGCALVTDWPNEFGLSANILKGGLVASGMYDLKPVRLSKRSRYVKFTDEIEQALSSQRHLDQLNAPINIFIHGGAWRNGQARDSAYLAETFINAGAHFVIPDFVLVQNAGGSLMPMAQQVRSAVAWVYRNAAHFGGDPARVYITGHSSGAHLAGCALVTDWPKEFGLPANILKAGLVASGMYDLKPVRLSKRSQYVKFTDEIEQTLSSQRHLDQLNAPIIVAYGTQETPEFQRQNREFAAAVKTAGKPVELIVGEGFNHFELQETIGNPYGILGRAALKMMNLSMSPGREQT